MRARSPSAIARRAPSDRVDPSASRVAAPWARARSRSRASAMSISASRCRVPAKCASSRSMVTWRGSTFCHPSGSNGSSSTSSNRLIASATSRSSCAGPTLPATAATWASTHPAASGVRAGVAWMVASATSLARHAGTRPAWTWPHSRGSRWRSSRAWPISRFAAVVDTPSTAPSSATQNSATAGHPSPGDGLLVLAPAGGERGGEWIDSGGCRSAHRAARSSRSAAARSSAALRSRAAARIPDASRSSTSGLLVEERRSWVVVMRTILPEPTDTLACGKCICGEVFSNR